VLLFKIHFFYISRHKYIYISRCITKIIYLEKNLGWGKYTTSLPLLINLLSNYQNIHKYHVFQIINRFTRFFLFCYVLCALVMYYVLRAKSNRPPVLALAPDLVKQVVPLFRHRCFCVSHVHLRFQGKTSKTRQVVTW
jgi:ATP/ADP translocase